MRCSPRLAGELLCASQQLRQYHSLDQLSTDEGRLSDREVERIDLKNTANPEKAEELQEMTADEMAVDGYYVVAGSARPEYKRVGISLPCGIAMLYPRQPGRPYQHLYSQMGVSTLSFVPTSLRTMMDSY